MSPFDTAKSIEIGSRMVEITVYQKWTINDLGKDPFVKQFRYWSVSNNGSRAIKQAKANDRMNSKVEFSFRYSTKDI